jgi:hypothetical protein
MGQRKASSEEELKFPTAEDLRILLLKSAARYEELTGIPRSVIGENALGDPAFVTQVEAGRDFRIKTFETFMLWLQDHWPRPKRRAKRNGK